MLCTPCRAEQAVANQVVVAAIDASAALMAYDPRNYPSPGIFTGACSSDYSSSETNLHAVLVVGYTPTYWILKNSWGPGWGDDGYFYLPRGVNACGLTNFMTYPIADEGGAREGGEWPPARLRMGWETKNG